MINKESNINKSAHIPTEYQEQLAVMAYIRSIPTISRIGFHTANEGRRTPFSGFCLKQMGMLAGVSDIFIPYPNGRFSGLWLELKRVKGGTLSIEQKQWLVLMQKNGYAACMRRGSDAAKATIDAYLAGTYVNEAI